MLTLWVPDFCAWQCCRRAEILLRSHFFPFSLSVPSLAEQGQGHPCWSVVHGYHSSSQLGTTAQVLRSGDPTLSVRMVLAKNQAAGCHLLCWEAVLRLLNLVPAVWVLWRSPHAVGGVGARAAQLLLAMAISELKGLAEARPKRTSVGLCLVGN